MAMKQYIYTTYGRVRVYLWARARLPMGACASAHARCACALAHTPAHRARRALLLGHEAVGKSRPHPNISF